MTDPDAKPTLREEWVAIRYALGRDYPRPGVPDPDPLLGCLDAFQDGLLLRLDAQAERIAALERERDTARSEERTYREATEHWVKAYERLDADRAALRAEREVLTRLAAERWDRWQRADARVAELEAALRGFYDAYQRADSNRGCFSCSERHDLRCESHHKVQKRCSCGRVELDAAEESARAALSITGEEDVLEEVNLPRLPTSHRTIRALIRRAPEATCEWSYDGSIWTGCAGKHWPSKPERCHECGRPIVVADEPAPGPGKGRAR